LLIGHVIAHLQLLDPETPRVLHQAYLAPDERQRTVPSLSRRCIQYR
jgi:hypothetical protein